MKRIFLLVTMIALMGLWGSAWAGIAVSTNVSNPEHVVARTTNAAEIRIGVLERLEEKAKYTTSFLEDLRTTKRPIEYIDLTYTQAVIPKQDPVQK